MYVPLLVKSHFSFLEGASAPEEIAERAHALGLPATALTDRDGTYGVVRAHARARDLGVRLLSGAEVTLGGGSTIILLAADRTGWRNLCRLITAGRRRSPKGTSSVSIDEAAGHAEGLVALSGGGRGILAGEPDPGHAAAILKDAFGNRLYALVARHRRAEEVPAEARLRDRAARFGIPTVAGNEVLYHDAARRPLQDVLACVRAGTTLAAAGRILKPNDLHAMASPEAMAALFADDPGSLARTLEVASRCTFSLSELRYRYPAGRIEGGVTEGEWLRRLALEGARERLGGEVPPSLLAQIGRELALIGELGYGGYFLTMHEIVTFCRARGILCQGRGSAANSAVCYALGITAVDPRRVDLLFERFLSRERAEPPDIDLDIMHERREEVIQHVYDRFGRDRAAMVASVIRHRTRSAIRDVGKALGLPAAEVDRMAKTGIVPPGPITRLVEEIQDVPRHLSIHPGGFLLGHEPVSDLVPIENAAMEGRTVIQWDKDDLETLGLFKVDLLGLGALTHLDKCLRLLSEHERLDLSMDRIPDGDPATFEMISRGDTVGVFQVESRAQMAMLPRLRPRTWYDLVIAVSIVRPGPITGGMVHPYLRRRHGEEAVEYPHPCLEPVLKKTLGIPLFQEQVIRLAMAAADYTPGEADRLRRDMAAWRKGGRIEGHRERLVPRMVAKGIPAEFAGRIFDQIRGFGEYGFPESHAASFALLSYATAWLKRHHPAAFTCALLNSQPMGFYAPSTVIEDAKRHGLEIRPPDVSAGGWDCALERCRDGSLAVRLGLQCVKGLSRERDVRPIERARREGPFRSVGDLAARARLGAPVLARLAAAGALASLEPERRPALWCSLGIPAGGPPPIPAPEETPAFPPLDRRETISWDYEATGQSAAGHPLEPLRPALAALGLPDARGLNAMPHGRRASYAGIVICRQRPSTASGVAFMTLEDETGLVNAILWARVFDRFRVLAKTAPFLGVTGRIDAKDGVVHLIADSLWIPRIGTAPPAPESHDFR